MVTSSIDITLGQVRKTSRENFINDHVLRLKAELARYPITADQVWAWEVLCGWLHDATTSLDNQFDSVGCLFEFAPPMKEKRSDLILTSEKEIYVIEAKTGDSHTRTQAQKQALEYANQIYCSLQAGIDRKVIPMVLQDRPDRGRRIEPTHIVDHDYAHKDVAVIGASDLASRIGQMTPPRPTINLLDTSEWMHQPRASVQTITQEMFGSLRTGEVIKALANPEEIERLIRRVQEIVTQARQNSEHRVVAITGRPGSGKTLVGLRIAHQTSLPADLIGPDSKAPIYLSGNAPLVAVLQESIARSRMTSVNQYNKKMLLIEKARQLAAEIILEVKAVESKKFAIASNVVIFDEAQRAWTEKHLRRKRKNRTLGSQPYEILRKMSEKPWAVVICLVGTGQHINQGEHGMDTWYEAVGLNPKSQSSTSKSPWRISVHHNEKREAPFIDQVSDLELTVDMRACSTSINEWVNLLLEHKIADARACRSKFPQFPLHVCRELEVAKNWLTSNTNFRRDESAGLLASSKSGRLQHYGIRLESVNNFPAINWYLEKPPHLDSSSSFDIAATEYDCQGLELDRVCVAWSWDLVTQGGAWTPRRLNRQKAEWSVIGNEYQREYLLNAYRVLLTRSRAGMVIWIPTGDSTDSSRPIRAGEDLFKLLIDAGCDPLT